MKGSNKLTLNTVTMIEAVQMYLSSLFAEGKAPFVSGVKADNSSGTFEISVLEKEKEVKNDANS